MPQNPPGRDSSRRQLEQQLRDRAAQDAARQRRTVIGAVVGAVLVVGVAVGILMAATSGGGSPAPAAGASGAALPSGTAAATGSTPSTAPAANPGGPRTPGSCTFTPDGTAARKVTAPAATAPTTGTAVVDVATDRGAMTFTLDRRAAPCTVASFVSLVRQKFYDGTPCHRLTTPASGISVLQCGDPTGTGTGGPGYTIPDELTGTEKYTPGVLAMANTGAPNSGGSQFFIVYADTPLPPKYTVFGTVSKGLDVVDAVAAKGVAGGGADGAPALPIRITSMKVVK